MKKLLDNKLLISLILFFLTFIGFILRINDSYTTMHDDAWELDEAMQILKGNKPFYKAGEHPFLFPSILFLTLKIFGMNGFTIHLPNLIFGTLLIPLMYFFGKISYNKQVGLLAAAISAVLPSLVSYSRSILLEMPLTFFSILTLFLFYIASRKKSYIFFIISGVAFGLCCLSKEAGILNLIPISFLSIKNANKKNIFGFLMTVIIGCSMFVSWIILNPSGFSYILSLFLEHLLPLCIYLSLILSRQKL